jgi:uncharacterized membrane protein (UPF0182 family)
MPTQYPPSPRQPSPGRARRRPRPSRARALVASGAAAALLVLSMPAVAAFVVDWAWFSALGFEGAFLTPVRTQVALFAAGTLVAAAVLVGSLAIVRRACSGLVPYRTAIPEAAGEVDVGTPVNRVVLPLAGVGALLFGAGAAQAWPQALLSLHGRGFGVTDPVFGRDAGFYVFHLPLLDGLLDWAAGLVLLTFLVTAALHFLLGGIAPARKGALTFSRAARLQLAILGTGLFVLVAFGSWLGAAHLVLDQHGLVAGAGYADVYGRLPMFRTQVVVALLSAALLPLSQLRPGMGRRFGPTVLVAVSALVFLARLLYPALLQSYAVDPNEQELERAFLRHEIQGTRVAYGLEELAEHTLVGGHELTVQDLESHRATLENIRVWDHRPLLDTFGQIQEIRTYYDFDAVDNDRYVIDGELRQTMLSPRELVAASLPNRTWVNEHFTFTHGYGVTLGPVNSATEEGLPELFVQDIPPRSSVPEDLRVTRPAVYYGERTDGYAFVRTEAREFDHPSGEGNVYAAYDGEGGVDVGATWFRGLVALDLGELNVFLSRDITAESRVLLHRQIEERVRRVAPFLRLDEDPYMVIREDGSMAWIVDAYTVSRRFPYARQVEVGGQRLNYIRNSVKVVVDAYDGDVTFYVADEEDPVLAAWRRAFPDLFTPLSAMPTDLRAHLRYPLDIFSVQAEVLATYHFDEPDLLYNREDQWEIPRLGSGADTAVMEPYYTVMRLPGEAEAEFILMLPFTPARKENLAAWLVARNDGDALGDLRIHRFPNDRLVFGPQQVLDRIHQDAEISAQLSLWDQRGSEAEFGTLLVIPIEESLLYVLPLYLRSEGGQIPQLKRVVVVYRNSIAMERTLEEAVREALGAPMERPAPRPAGEDLRARALGLFEEAVSAQREGDWAVYGSRLEALGEALRAMQAEAAAEEAPVDAPDLVEDGEAAAP